MNRKNVLQPLHFSGVARQLSVNLSLARPSEQIIYTDRKECMNGYECCITCHYLLPLLGNYL